MARVLLVALALAGPVPFGCGGGDPPLPPGPLTIRVTGDEYEWRVRYPGPDGALDTPDDVLDMRDLHLPAVTPIEVQLESTDYIYGFRIPALGVNEMAVPELHFRASFQAVETGSHQLKGDQMCGFSHESLLGTVVVHTRADFGRWLARQASLGGAR